jgi:N-acetylglucosamine-6-sulfatase
MLGLLLSLDGRAKPQPNIVLIVSDDEDLRSHAFMRKTRALLHERGTVFNNYFVTASLCCPSRTSILRGQYPHNTKVRGNVPP